MQTNFCRPSSQVYALIGLKQLKRANGGTSPKACPELSDIPISIAIRPSQAKLRLLIVDDEEASRYGMRRALTTFGYSVSEADSAEAARILIKQQEPDLMLLDVNLPGISGLDFLKELQEGKNPEDARGSG